MYKSKGFKKLETQTSPFILWERNEPNHRLDSYIHPWEIQSSEGCEDSSRAEE